ncbi:MAG: hypothetical protein PSU94_18300 [Lacunisphaera sp.]|nr:hypothetical protein [Lacunisphaera sp.]
MSPTHPLCSKKAHVRHLIFLLVLATGGAARALALEPTRPQVVRPPESQRLADPPRVQTERNYDEAKVGSYTLPDPLRLQSEEPVRDAETWLRRRRPELLALYEKEIYGRVPVTALKLHFAMTSTTPDALDGAAIRQDLVGRMGDGANAPAVRLVLFLPAKAPRPVPVVLHMLFKSPPDDSRKVTGEARTAPEIIARGYAYAVFSYADVEGDHAHDNLALVRRAALAPGQAVPASDEWGTVAAWAWAASCVIDHLETEPAVDAKRVALVGLSRLGKTALWAGARDPRFALVFSACSGKLGAALSRRNYGEKLDDMSVNFPWWFTSEFFHYAGRWDDLPLDANVLIA